MAKGKANETEEKDLVSISTTKGKLRKRRGNERRQRKNEHRARPNMGTQEKQQIKQEEEIKRVRERWRGKNGNSQEV